MSARISQEARDATARVIAGEAKAKVSRETGVSRSTIDRHLMSAGLMRRRRKPVYARSK